MPWQRKSVNLYIRFRDVVHDKTSNLCHNVLKATGNQQTQWQIESECCHERAQTYTSTKQKRVRGDTSFQSRAHMAFTVQVCIILGSITILLFKPNRLINVHLSSYASQSQSSLYKSALAWLHEARQDRNVDISSLAFFESATPFVSQKTKPEVKMLNLQGAAKAAVLQEDSETGLRSASNTTICVGWYY